MSDVVVRGKLNIYLDNCCFNRPYDDQTQLRIEIETKAKQFVQIIISTGDVNLTVSSMLRHENKENPFEERKLSILSFIDRYAHKNITATDEIRAAANKLTNKGLRSKDATHLAFAIAAGCDYFLTTDDKLLKFKDKRIVIINPQDFLRIWEAYKNDAGNRAEENSNEAFN